MLNGFHATRSYYHSFGRKTNYYSFSSGGFIDNIEYPSQLLIVNFLKLFSMQQMEEPRIHRQV